MRDVGGVYYIRPATTQGVNYPAPHIHVYTQCHKSIQRLDYFVAICVSKNDSIIDRPKYSYGPNNRDYVYSMFGDQT